MPSDHTFDYSGHYDPHIALVHNLIRDVVKIDLDDADYDDLLQTGRIAIWEASKLHRPQESAFSTYAYPAIRNALIRWLQHHTLHGFTRAREPGTRKSVVEQPKSLDFGLEDWGDKYSDTIADGRSNEALAAQELAENQAMAWGLMGELASKDADLAMVIYGRFFLGQSLREIGERMGGVCREYIRQLEAEALKWLRHRAERRCP